MRVPKKIADKEIKEYIENKLDLVVKPFPSEMTFLDALWASEQHWLTKCLTLETTQDTRTATVKPDINQVRFPVHRFS